MHDSQFRHMARSIEKYMPQHGHFDVVELGSRSRSAHERTHREQMGDRDVTYTGVDLLKGRNVDIVMAKPYTLPVGSRSVDVLIAGSVFEHVPFVWATMLEVSRVLRPGGYAFVTAPSRGHEHNVYDCWRYYPDAYRALAAWSTLELREVFTDFPPRIEGTYHHDYAAIDTQRSYWGDSVAVFQKPRTSSPSLRHWVLRSVVRAWANAHPDLEAVPRPDVDPARNRIHGRD